jgi:RNA polymerase sigma-70 factor (ECF subfamily)
MDDLSDMEVGPFDAKYRAFLGTITELRPRLHRYCARMTGSAMDGEDVVQEALFEAYRKLDQFDDSRPLQPWLFRIAYHRCIDFRRRRGVRQQAEAEAVSEIPDSVMPAEAAGAMLGHAVEHLVLCLPPKERACVLLKDVFGHSLEEIAGIVDSTVGGVKAALSRSRSKLKTAGPPAKPKPANPETARLVRHYVERFNCQDWDGLRELISDDARLRVADHYSGRLADAPYFSIYAKWPSPLKMAAGEIDGEPAVIILQRSGEVWKPRSAIRLEIANNRVTRIFDCMPCAWLLEAATVEGLLTS